MAHVSSCDQCRIAVSDAAYDAMTTMNTEEHEIAAPEPLAVGNVVEDRYRVEGVLGRGGMGAVYAARHMQRGHLVALKVMAHTSSSGIARFLREAATCSALTSEHIARVFDSGKLPSGAPWLAMEHLDGSDLSVVRKGGELAVEDAVLYVAHACRGLEEAHALGVVHRDIKPENLFLTRRADGSPLVKILDFGVSKVDPASVDGEATLTVTRALLGTPVYMAPEQLLAAKRVDQRADIWSVGVVLYELLTGRLPFAGSNLLALAYATAMTTPPPVSSLRPGVPWEIDQCVESCLQTDVGRRYSRIEKVGMALEPFVRR